MRLNDIHSQLNATTVLRVEPVADEAGVRDAIARAREDDVSLAIAGGRHAMGGQQFLTAGVVLDVSALDQVLAFDDEAGTVTVQPGIQWPELLAWLERAQGRGAGIWTFRQKQTGADSLSIGGAVSANVHGRGLAFAPFVDDVESLAVIDAHGHRHVANRTENPDLFALVVGGYGLFGVIVEVTLRLVRRTMVQRVVEVVDVDDLPARFDARLADGYAYGDWQYHIDPTSPHYMRRGIFSCYRPVDPDEAQRVGEPSGQIALDRSGWAQLVTLASHDKSRAFELYHEHYLKTDGQYYWSDTHQNATYLDNYAELLLEAQGGDTLATLMISELYVPRERLPAFLAGAADALREHDVEVLYGTVRLIERDDVTVLAWAREPWACVIFNLLVVHSEDGIARAANAFRALIDVALELEGSYYLTYHRWALAAQLLRAHPRIGDFVDAKRRWDPDGMFHSDWYDHVEHQVDDAR